MEGGGETQDTSCECLVRKTGNAVARVRVSRTRDSIEFTTPASRAVGAAQSALGVGGCGTDIFSNSCSSAVVWCFLQKFEKRTGLGCFGWEDAAQARKQVGRSTFFILSLSVISSESPLQCSSFYSKLRAPHRGTFLGSCVCGAN
jgi:hypothetical protein